MRELVREWRVGGDVEPLPAGVTAREANLENGLAFSAGGEAMGEMVRDFKSSTILLSGAGVLPMERVVAWRKAGGRLSES